MKNSKPRRILLTLACAVLLVSLSVGATLAYLTSEDSAKNTFTVGQVKITLDEQPVDENGRAVDGKRLQKNEYHLMPGFTYDKDPTIHVDSESELCWVWAMIEVAPTAGSTTTIANIRDLIGYPVEEGAAKTHLGLNQLVTGGVFNPNNAYDGPVYEGATETWTTEKIRLVQWPGENQNYFLVCYLQPQQADADLVLFEKLNIPAEWDNTEIIKLNNTEINITAYAIQADGFDNIDDAMASAEFENTIYWEVQAGADGNNAVVRDDTDGE